MADENFMTYNIIGNLDIEKPIYRYMKIEHVVSMFKEKKLSLAQVKTWDDPYENFFFKLKFALPDGGKIVTKNIQEGYFGQSWTLLEESDAMWRIYSHEKDAIKLKTTPQKLLDTINANSCMYNLYIGKVQYYAKKKMMKWISDLSESVHNNPLYPLELDLYSRNSLFCKRNEFSHECEVRIIKNIDGVIMDKIDNLKGSHEKDITRKMTNLQDIDKETTDEIRILKSEDCYKKDYAKKILYDIYIEPNELIDELCLDPRIDSEEEKKIKNELIKVGVCPEKIRKSSLYDLDLPSDTILLA